VLQLQGVLWNWHKHGEHSKHHLVSSPFPGKTPVPKVIRLVSFSDDGGLKKESRVYNTKCLTKSMWKKLHFIKWLLLIIYRLHSSESLFKKITLSQTIHGTHWFKLGFFLWICREQIRSHLKPNEVFLLRSYSVLERLRPINSLTCLFYGTVGKTLGKPIGRWN